jgi:hypothetical protein
MNATMYVMGAGEARSPVLRVVPPLDDRSDRDLRLDAGVGPHWRALSAGGRAGVAAFLGGARGLELLGFECTDPTLPEDFARDVAAGGKLLRAAFPDLVRSVKSVDRTGPDEILVRVGCEGHHGAAFFGILSPTGRRVAFDVVHSLVVSEGNVVQHRVTLDVPAIISQLVAGPR